MIVLFSTPQVTALGTKFENVSKLFDHAAHNASNCLNSYCFVSLTLCMPAQKHDKISYLTVPLVYRMWQRKNQNCSLLHLRFIRLCLNFRNRKILSSFVTANINPHFAIQKIRNVNNICFKSICSFGYSSLPSHLHPHLLFL